ncbi:MAG: folate-binding protein YgfZ [Verrucomicrobiales bacterium]|jgi:folate-binding protein YgfZ
MPTQAIDLGARTVLRLSGGDRERYLNGQVSNDVRKLSGENAIAACVTTLKGKLDALVHITTLDEAFLIDSEIELREPLHARLDKYIIADDCELEDVSDDWRLVHVLGRIETEHATRKSERFGQPGTDIWLPTDSEIPTDIDLLTPAASESLRIRNGVPKWGAELTPDTLPAEAGLDATAVDFHKGCYIGQEVISRIKSVGRVNRQLRCLRVNGGSATPGQPLFSGETKVGQLTSVSGEAAVGYIKRGHQDVGTSLTLEPDPTGEKNLSTSLEIVESSLVRGTET